MKVAEILISVLFIELVGLFLLLMFVLGAIIVEKVVDVKALKLRVSRVKEIEQKNGELYEETETLKAEILRLEKNETLLKQAAILWEEAAKLSDKKVEDILQGVHDLGGCDATDEWSKGYDAAVDTVYDLIKTRFSEGEK